MARAHKVIERQHREEAEDNDIDSSDSMEGVEASNTIGIESDTDDDSVNSQSSVFSPRKMRSSRIVKYQDGK